jgi:hypothetical protein
VHGLECGECDFLSRRSLGAQRRVGRVSRRGEWKESMVYRLCIAEMQGALYCSGQGAGSHLVLGVNGNEMGCRLWEEFLKRERGNMSTLTSWGSPKYWNMAVKIYTPWI